MSQSLRDDADEQPLDDELAAAANYPLAQAASPDDRQEQEGGGDPTLPPLPVLATAMPSDTAAPSLAQTASRAMLWNTVLFPVKFVVSIVSSIILANLLVRTDYGLVAIISSIASTIGLYADLGIERSLPRFVPEVEQAGGPALVRRFLWQLIGIKLAVMALLVGGLFIFGQALVNSLADKQTLATIALLGQLGGFIIFTLAALLVLGALFDTFMQFLLSYFKQRAWNVITIAATLLQPALIILFFSTGYQQVEYVLLAMIITPLISVLLAGRQALRLANNPTALREGGAAKMGNAANLPPSFHPRFLRYSAIAYFMNISVYFYTLPFINLVINAGNYRFDGVALFAVAYNFVNQVITVLWSPLSGLQVPLFSRIYAQDKERAGGQLAGDAKASLPLQESYTVLSKFLALVLIPSGIGLALLATNLVYTLYAKYGAASLTAVVLTVFLFAEAAISIPQNILMVYERFRPVLWSRAVSLVSIPLLFWLIPAFDATGEQWLGMGNGAPLGLVGAAVAAGVARILSRLVVFIYAEWRMGLHYPFAFALRVLLASVPMAGIVRLLAILIERPPIGASVEVKLLDALLNVAIALLGGAVFIVSFKRLGGLDADDKRRLGRMKLPIPARLMRWL